MKTIVALVDFSDVTARVIDQATQLARAFAARLILLHVVPEQPAVVELGIASPTVLQAPSEQRIEADYNALLELRNSLADSGVTISVQQLERASVGKVLELIQHLETDVIVVGTHHHSALYQFFVGTFTSDILKRATCPVLVVPAANRQPA